MSEKTIAQKLYLKPGRKLLILNAPQGFIENIGELPPFAKIIELPEQADVVLQFVKNLTELQTWFATTAVLALSGASLWVAYPKKTGRLKSDIDRDILNIYVHTQGWEGVSIFAIDNDWSALRVKPK